MHAKLPTFRAAKLKGFTVQCEFDCRDPNLQQTLDRFAASAVWVANGEFTDRDIDEAKLSVFSQVTLTDSRWSLVCK